MRWIYLWNLICDPLKKLWDSSPDFMSFISRESSRSLNLINLILLNSYSRHISRKFYSSSKNESLINIIESSCYAFKALLWFNPLIFSLAHKNCTKWMKMFLYPIRTIVEAKSVWLRKQGKKLLKFKWMSRKKAENKNWITYVDLICWLVSSLLVSEENEKCFSIKQQKRFGRSAWIRYVLVFVAHLKVSQRVAAAAGDDDEIMWFEKIFIFVETI